jgi:S1-C subfamily serine protease
MQRVPQFGYPNQFQKQPPRKNSTVLLTVGTVILVVVLLAGGAVGLSYVLIGNRILDGGRAANSDIARSAHDLNNQDDLDRKSIVDSVAGDRQATPPDQVNSSRPDRAVSNSAVGAPANSAIAALPAHLKSNIRKQLSDGPDSSMKYRLKPDVDYGISFVVELTSGSNVTLTKGRTVYRLTNDDPRALMNNRVGLLEEDFKAKAGTGTGFAVHPEGVIVTCAHVVEGVENVSVSIDGRQIPGRVIAVDSQNDLAMVKVEHAFERIIALNDELPEQGESCRAIGFPLSSELGNKVKVSTGSIVGDDMRMHERRLQIDATVNPGNSGGPVVGENGELYGVADSIIVAEGTQDMSFAVPVDVVRNTLTRAGVPFDSTHFGEGHVDRKTVTSYKDALKCTYLITVGGAQTKAPVPSDLMVLSFTCNLTEGAKQTSSNAGRMVIDQLGKVHFTDDSPSLPFFVSRASTIGFERFPSVGQTTWKAIDTMQVSVNLPGSNSSPDDELADLLNGNMFMPGFRRPGIPGHGLGSQTTQSIDIMVAKIQAYKKNDNQTFSKEFAVMGGDPMQERPSLVVQGTGTATIDSESGFATSSTINGDYRSALSGKNQMGKIRITHGYMTEAEMRAQEEAEKIRQDALAESTRKAAEQAAAERRQKLAVEIKAKDTKLTSALDKFDPDK